MAIPLCIRHICVLLICILLICVCVCVCVCVCTHMGVYKCKTCMCGSLGPGWCPGVRDTAMPVSWVLSQAHCGVIRPGSFVPPSASLPTIATAQAGAVTETPWRP